jgi:hypothetical protein
MASDARLAYLAQEKALAEQRAELAEKTIERVLDFADEMGAYCSPYGVSALYAERLRDVVRGDADA